MGTMIGDAEINGRECEIHASKGGMWSIYLVGSEDALASGRDDLDDVKKRASAAIGRRKVKVSVPFVTQLGEHGVAYGIHGRSRDVQVDYGARRETLSTYGERDAVLKADTPPATLERLLELQDAVRDAERELREIREKYGFDLKKAVNEAIDEKAGDQQ